MIELDDRLLLLQRTAHEWATQMRIHGMELDRDPNAIERHLDLPVARYAGALQVPERFNPDPVIVDGQRLSMRTSLERVVLMEECAWGDLGFMLAAPGAPMAGVMVDLLGDEEQKEWFFGRVLKEPTWTFFALTEASGGSDAASMQTTLSPAADGGYILNGAKRYSVNGARGQIGVVFARTGPGPLGLNAVLLDTSTPGFHVQPIPTFGLNAVKLGAITLDNVHVPAEHLLGRQLSAIKRGMWAWVRMFNVLRPAVASMGVGVSRAAVEYVEANRSDLRRDERDRLDAMTRRIAEVRMLIRRAAVAADADNSAGVIASAAKVRSAQLAEDVTMAALGFFGPGARLEHPFLDKLARDARGIEFMEGTTNIQRMNLFAGLRKGITTSAGRTRP